MPPHSNSQVCNRRCSDVFYRHRKQQWLNVAETHDVITRATRPCNRLTWVNLAVSGLHKHRATWGPYTRSQHCCKQAPPDDSTLPQFGFQSCQWERALLIPSALLASSAPVAPERKDFALHCIRSAGR